MHAEKTQNETHGGLYDPPARFRKGSGAAIRQALPGSVRFADAPAVLIAGWKMLTDKQKLKALSAPART